MNNEGNDINVGSIEEDIKNIRQYINLVLDKGYCECNELNVISTGKYCDGSKNVAYSMQNILAELEQKDKLIKELEKENEELLELKISVSSMNIIQNLEKEKIKLEKRCFIAEGNLKTTKKELRDYFYNSIPKQVVIDKIKELNKEWEKEIENSKTLTSQRRLIIAGQCSILQKLL